MMVLRFPISEAQLKSAAVKRPALQLYSQDVFEAAYRAAEIVLHHLLHRDIPVFMIGWQTLFDRDKGASMVVAESTLSDHPSIKHQFSRVWSYQIRDWLMKLDAEDDLREQVLGEIANRFLLAWYQVTPEQDELESSVSALRIQVEAMNASDNRWNFVVFNKVGLLFIEVFVIENLIERQNE